MNVKKFAVIGVLALVVIGCVVAAGCTSQVNTDPDQVNPASGDTYIPITDESNSSYSAENLSKMKTYLTFDKNGGDTDGHGEITTYQDQCSVFVPATRTGYTCTGYYDSPTEGTKIINSDGTVSDTAYYPLALGGTSPSVIWTVPYTINTTNGEYDIHPYYYTFYAHWVEDSTTTSDDEDDENPIVNSWVNDNEEDYTFYSDKTGLYTIYVNGNWDKTPFTWEMNSDGTYTITIGEKKTYIILNKNKNHITFDSGRIFELEYN